MINKDYILEQAEKFVRSKLAGEGSGHDWWHIVRVRALAKTIAQKEGANEFICELAALLHDIADWKFNNGDTSVGAEIAKDFLESLGVEVDIVNSVSYIVEHSSFKGAGTENGMETLEGKVVQDTDRLDAIGAIGIARIFAYGGAKGREMYNPEIKPTLHANFDEYKKSNGPTINHFYEKLLLLKDRMNTQTAKELAKHRHNIMEQYLQEFYAEWNGEK